jgi:hypothetical protein
MLLLGSLQIFRWRKFLRDDLELYLVQAGGHSSIPIVAFDCPLSPACLGLAGSLPSAL